MQRRKGTYDMYHVIINPASRSGRALALWQKSKYCFQEAGIPYKVYYSKYQGQIEEICRKLTQSGQDVKLVVFGGDGTINEAINGIQDFSHVQLGYVPTGSSNDLARGLGLSKDPEKVLQQILKGETMRTIDLGVVQYLEEDTGSRRFIVSAGIGFDAAICQEVAISPFKKVLNRLHLGKLIYLAVAIRLILTHPMVPASVSLIPQSNKKVQEEKKNNTAKKNYTENQQRESKPASALWKFRRFLFIVCMNHPFEGGGFKFCPAARGNDGILDLCGVADLNRLMFFYLFPKAYNGGHVGFKGIHTSVSPTGSSILIRTAQPSWVHTDGEVRRKASEIRIDTLPGILQLMM